MRACAAPVFTSSREGGDQTALPANSLPSWYRPTASYCGESKPQCSFPGPWHLYAISAAPDFSRRRNPITGILAFGKWGPYKRLEPICEAYRLVADRIPKVKLVIGGRSHPGAPGYVKSIAKNTKTNPHRFTATSRIGHSNNVPEFFGGGHAYSSHGSAPSRIWPAPMEYRSSPPT